MFILIIGYILTNDVVYNWNTPLKYDKFNLFFDFISQEDLNLKKENDYLTSIESDFGTISWNNYIFQMDRIEIKTKDVIKINDFKFPMELDVYGHVNKNDSKKKLKFSIIFEKSNNNNLFLYNIGFGKGKIKDLCKLCQSKINFNFNIQDLIKEEKYFIKYEEKDQIQVILYETLDISESQINELQKIKSQIIPSIPKKIIVYQNKLKNDSFIEIKKKSIQNKKLNYYLILDDYLEKPRFYIEDKYILLKNKIENDIKKKNKAKKKTNKNKKGSKNKKMHKSIYTPFEIYSPPQNFPWGYVYKGAIMPWEKILVNKRKYILKINEFKLPSPLKGYKYIPFFYYKTRNNYKIDGKYIYIPYLILVNNSFSNLNLPLSNLEIYNPSINRVQKVEIFRDFNGKLKKQNKKTMKEIANKLNVREHKNKIKKVTKIVKKVNKKAKKIKNLIKKHKKKIKINKTEDDNSNKIVEDNLPKVNYSKKPHEGGYSVKKIESDKKKNKKLANKLISKLNLKSKKIRRFPKMNIPINQKPSNCHYFTDNLNNSLILNLDMPKSDIKNSKYVALLYCQLDYKFTDSRKIYIPIYYLVNSNFYFKYKKNNKDNHKYKMPKMIPFIKKKNKSKHTYINNNLKFRKIDIAFKNVIKNIDFDKPLKNYENPELYLSQNRFNRKMSAIQYKFNVNDVKKQNKKISKNLNNSINSLESELNKLN